MKLNHCKKLNIKKIFDPLLFWDAEKIDTPKNADYIIARVLDFGNKKDIKTLRSIYSDRRIIDVIKKRRGLLPQTGKYWAVYSNLRLEEIACLRKYCQKMRSA